MLLQKLREYSERLDLPPALYAEAPVRYIVDLDVNGRFLGLVDTADASSPRTRRGVRRQVPVVVRTSATRPLLLCDNGEYTFGLVFDGKASRAKERHDAYFDLVTQCVETTGDPAVAAVAAFLRRDPIGEAALDEHYGGGDTVTFRVDGEFVIDRSSVQRFWAAMYDPSASESGEEIQCLVCGLRQPEPIQASPWIKGIPGGQTAGTQLIGMNGGAFISYEAESPVCADCRERFTHAINGLLSGEETRYSLPGSVFTFWTREPVSFNPMTFFRDPAPDDVRGLLDSLRSGSRPLPLADERFYAVSLTASGARTVVRDWIDTTIGEVQERLARWFQWQAIVGRSGEDPEPLGLYPLAAATVRDPRRDLAPPTGRALVRAALIGTPLPAGLLMEAVRRNRAEQGVTRPRAALIKLVLQSWRERASEEMEEEMIRLEPQRDSPGYQCGRLLAVLEEVQRAALPGINATIVDRFYGTASSAPASVFPRLLRGAQPHLAKLERDRRGTWSALQARLGDVQGQLADYPTTLSLREQGLFALGYYHQRASDRAQARAAAERKRAGTATGADEALAETNDDAE